MIEAPLSDDESARLHALRSYGILDTPAEERFDDLVKLAADICDVPIALISLVDDTRQWFKAKVGVAVPETPRSIAFCTHCILQHDLFEVPDAASDPRFKDNPLVTADPMIRFYAGCPIKTADGHALGTLCVIDRVARKLTEQQAQALQTLSRQAMALIELRRHITGLEALLAARKQAENTAAELRNAISHSLEGLALLDRNGTYVYMNQAHAAMYGFAPDELVGRTWKELYTHDIITDIERHYFPALIKQGRWRGELIGRRKDGTLFEVEVALQTRKNDAGQFDGLLCYCRDLTERSQTQEQLHRSELFLDSILEHLPNMVFVKDAADFRFLRFNKAGETLLGYPRETLLGKNDYDFFPPEQADFFTAKDRAVIEGRTMVDVPEEPIQTKDKGIRYLHTKKIPLYDATGKPTYIVGISEDITERREAHDRIQRMNAELEQRVHDRTAELSAAYEALQRQIDERQKVEAQFRQAQKLEAVGQLAGGIAHDFNNLLTIILGYGDTLIRQLDHNHPTRAFVDEIMSAGKQAATLTQQLLSFSRRQMLQPRVTNLNDTVACIEKMLARLIGEEIELTTELDPRLHSVQVDEGQMQQVLVNLAVNSRDAMPRGGRLTIRTANVVFSEERVVTSGPLQPGAYATLLVQDTGIGMTPDILSHIFEPFFTTKEVGKGTGLGLAMVHGTIAQSGGAIDVESRLGSGTTFRIYLPRVTPLPPAAPVEAASSRALAGKETILLVEDEASVRTMIRSIFTVHGYTVLEASSGETALDLCRNYNDPIHLLLTDIIMPKMRGRELAEQILTLKIHIKVLFMSGYTDDLTLAQTTTDHQSAFIQKPFTPSKLIEKVRQLLDSPAG
jgi:PAS domain S-box-containing protein